MNWFRKKRPYQLNIFHKENKWNQEDSEKLNLFLRSETGRKFRSIQELAVHQMVLITSERTSLSDGERIGRVKILEELDILSQSRTQIKRETTLLNSEILHKSSSCMR